MSLGERVMSLTRNFKTIMIIIQNATTEDITFLPEGGKVVYFKMHSKVTTVLELSSKVYLKAHNLKDIHEQPAAVQYTKSASPPWKPYSWRTSRKWLRLVSKHDRFWTVTVFITFYCFLTSCIKQLLDAWFDLYTHRM